MDPIAIGGILAAIITALGGWLATRQRHIESESTARASEIQMVWTQLAEQRAEVLECHTERLALMMRVGTLEARIIVLETEL